VLVFLDESRRQRPDKNVYCVTIAGAAVPVEAYDDYCRRLLRLKGRFFKRDGVGEFPLRGKRLLSRRKMESYRTLEFLREWFSLCRWLKVTVFSATRVIYAEARQSDFAEFADRLHRSALATDDQFDEKRCPLLLAHVMERVNSFMLENHPGAKALLIFKSEEEGRDRTRSAAMMNLFFKTPYGGGFQGILGSPCFAPTSHSPGLQTADLFAYIVNQYHEGRRDLQEFFAEVETLQWISAFERDELEIRSMMVIK
jgi:hypothetical protein